MIYHLDITTYNEYAVANTVKLSGDVVNIAYFTRNFMKVSPSPTSNWIIAKFFDGSQYILTHNQSSTEEEVFIVDTVDGVAPTSLADLALRITTPAFVFNKPS